MIKKKRIILSSTLFLFTSLLLISLANAQIPLDYVKISAYGTAYIDYSDTSIPERYEFSVAVPPSGSEIPNTIEIMVEGDENTTINLSAGDRVNIRWDTYNPVTNLIEPASESGHYTFTYEGGLSRLQINGTYIPEFSLFLLVPMFMVVTLLALIYRRKHRIKQH